VQQHSVHSGKQLIVCIVLGLSAIIIFHGGNRPINKPGIDLSPSGTKRQPDAAERPPQAGTRPAQNNPRPHHQIAIRLQEHRPQEQQRQLGPGDAAPADIRVRDAIVVGAGEVCQDSEERRVKPDDLVCCQVQGVREEAKRKRSGVSETDQRSEE
jgi:hypothetical protein